MKSLNIKVKNGIIQNEDFIVAGIASVPFFCFLNVLFKQASKEQIVNTFSKNHSSELTNYCKFCINNKLNVIKALRRFSLNLENLGLGKLEIIFNKNEHFKFKILKSPVFLRYNELFSDNHDDKIMSLYTSPIKRILEIYYKKKFTHKLSNYKKNNYYEIDFFINENEDSELGLDCGIKFKNLDFNKTTPHVLELIKYGYQLNSHTLYMAGISMTHFPLQAFVDLVCFNDVVLKDCCDIAYVAGASFENVHRNLGAKTIQQVFNGILNTIDTLGIGKISYNSHSEIFSYSNDFFDLNKEYLGDKKIEDFKKFVVSVCQGFYDICNDCKSDVKFLSESDFIFIKRNKSFILDDNLQKIWDKITYKKLL